MRELLDIARADAPPAGVTIDDIVAAGRRRRRFAVAQRAGGAAALLAAAVVTATVLVVTHDAAPDPRKPALAAAPAVRPFTFTVGGYTVDSYKVESSTEVTRAFEVATILGPTGSGTGQVGELTVFRPGAFDPAVVRRGSKRTVGGRDAYEVTLERKPHLAPGVGIVGNQQRRTTGLAWQYAADAWAVIDDGTLVSQDPFPVADMVRVAERLTLDQRVPARLPARPGHLPAGWTLQSVRGRTLDTGMARIVYGPPDTGSGPFTDRTDAWVQTASPSVIIEVMGVGFLPPSMTTDRYLCDAEFHRCTAALHGTAYNIGVNVTDPSGTLSLDDLKKIGESLTFADFTDPSTWPTAT